MSEMPDDWPPESWAPYVRLRLFAQYLLFLDKPSWVEARQQVTVDQIISMAREALTGTDGVAMDGAQLTNKVGGNHHDDS